METKAKVVALDGDFAIVETERTSACDGCHKQKEGSSCAMCTLLGDKAIMQTRANNPHGAQVGDWVIVESPSRRILGYGVLVFLLPLIVGMIFYFAAACLFVSEHAKLFSALVGFIGVFIFLWFYSNRVIARRCDVTIARVLGSDDQMRAE